MTSAIQLPPADTYTVAPPYHGEARTLWYLFDSAGDPVESTYQPDTVALWRHFTEPHPEPMTPGQLTGMYPRAEHTKLLRVACYCKDGMIRKR